MAGVRTSSRTTKELVIACHEWSWSPGRAAVSAERRLSSSRGGATGSRSSPGASAGLEGQRREVRELGVDALAVPTDVADYDQVAAAVERIEDEMGPIDVWVNVAFTSVFARFDDITPEEYRRATEVTYLGYVLGHEAVLPRMKQRNRGTIVHVGSALAYRGIPLQTAYCGAKHATQGFHEALRCELLHERSAVRVTMVQMPAVNTPQFSWVLSTSCPSTRSRSPPIYQPEVAARAVVFAADHPRRREYWVGSSTVGTLMANAVVAGPAGPIPRADRLLVAADQRPQAGRPSGQPLEARRRRRTGGTSAPTGRSTTVPTRGAHSSGSPTGTRSVAGAAAATVVGLAAWAVARRR